MAYESMVVWVLGLWVVASCVGFYWVVMGLLIAIVDVYGLRSEERRVGKEC